jgi:hypothetical protein
LSAANGRIDRTMSETRIGTPEQSRDILDTILMICELASYFETEVLDEAVADLPQDGLPARNAAVDSFALRTRQLIEFLTERDGRDRAAGDFTTGPWQSPADSEKDELLRLHARFSQQFVHLSLARDVASPEDRQVFARQIIDTLKPSLRRFLAAANPDRLWPDFVAEARQALGEPATPTPQLVAVPKLDAGLGFTDTKGTARPTRSAVPVSSVPPAVEAAGLLRMRVNAVLAADLDPGRAGVPAVPVPCLDELLAVHAMP